ncbi:hypothetical protein [Actomonas aquatica]|uniref:Glycosyltransferase RgtA/B/C/D-like domain-containing protein n=1 Tax=Actomonas aquatica TaxID=2866162 RepID=A0ABZ1C6H0_9BACT|nr:hypothetical protein [Opitutus sp. WL0086]WRQ87327.1 hypothetical protein K1X11_021140 [Opitutus sp. WL0086]
MPASVSPASTPASIVRRHAWWIALIGALLVQWMGTLRGIARVEALSAMPTWSVDAPAVVEDSPTGYTKGQRRLIVPGHHNPSFWWITEAQQAAAEGVWRLRSVDYDAAPDGRTIQRTSPYRWWLIVVGWGRSVVTGEPLGAAIEGGALVADPLLLSLLLVGGVIYTVRRVGSVAGAMVAVGGVALFPLAAGFQAGAPDAHALGWVLAVGSVWPLVLGRGRMDFAVAGVLGGIGFWNNAGVQAPLLVALAVGALLRSWLRPEDVAASAWRSWAASGAVVTLAASVCEFGLGAEGGSLAAVHPVHAVAWWGLGEVLVGLQAWRRDGRAAVGGLGAMVLGGGVVAVLAWPIVGWWLGSGGLWAGDFYARELANHPAGGVAPSLGAWLQQAGGGAAKAATLVPLGLVIAAVVLGWRRVEDGTRGRLLLVGGATVVVAVLASMQLRWWNLLDGLALVSLAVWFAGEGAKRWVMPTMVVVLLVPGLVVGWPQGVGRDGEVDTTPREAAALVERDLAYWLRERGGEEVPVVFSTPIVSGALAYYGGMRAITSADESNEDGLLTAVRLAAANTEQEIQLLIESRGVTDIVLPLWDPALDQLVRRGYGVPEGDPLPRDAFAAALLDWDVPLWLRPWDYVIPREAPYLELGLTAFAVGEPQAEELALSRLADFFVQRGQLVEAQGVRGVLANYPRSAVAMTAMARVDVAVRDVARLNEVLTNLVPMLSRRSARDLPPDRRVSLATVFARVQRMDLARPQIEAALAELDAATLRTWNPGAVVDLLTVSEGLGVEWPDAEVRDVAVKLLPVGVR